MTRRTGSLPKITADECKRVAGPRSGVMDERISAAAALAVAKNVPDADAFCGWLGRRLAHYRWQEAERVAALSVADNQRFAHDACAHMAELRARLAHLPDMIRANAQAVAWDRYGVTWPELERGTSYGARGRAHRILEACAVPLPAEHELPRK